MVRPPNEKEKKKARPSLDGDEEDEDPSGQEANKRKEGRRRTDD